VAVALELAEGSRFSEKRWELLADGQVVGRLEQIAWWRRKWRAEAGPRAWELSPTGLFSGGMVARDDAGADVAWYRPRDGVLERRDAPALTVQRDGLLSGERALRAGDRELVRLQPRTWRRGIDLELGPGVALDEDLAMAVLLVCARLVVDRQDTTAATAGATTAAGAAAAGS
jgi:hypothetical protein